MRNLPAGVNSSDIPGNRSEDVAFLKDEEDLGKAVLETVREFLKSDSRIFHTSKVDLDEEMQALVDSIDFEKNTEKAKTERQKQRLKRTPEV